MDFHHIPDDLCRVILRFLMGEDEKKETWRSVRDTGSFRRCSLRLNDLVVSEHGFWYRRLLSTGHTSYRLSEPDYNKRLSRCYPGVKERMIMDPMEVLYELRSRHGICRKHRGRYKYDEKCNHLYLEWRRLAFWKVGKIRLSQEIEKMKPRLETLRFWLSATRYIETYVPLVKKRCLRYRDELGCLETLVETNQKLIMYFMEVTQRKKGTRVKKSSITHE